MKTLGFLPRNWHTRDYCARANVSRDQFPHWTHVIPGSMEDVRELDVAIVLDVLHLFTISVRLFESFDNNGSSRGTDGNLNNKK